MQLKRKETSGRFPRQILAGKSDERRAGFGPSTGVGEHPRCGAGRHSTTRSATATTEA